MTTNDLLKLLGINAISGFVSNIDYDGNAACNLDGVSMMSYFPKGDLKQGDRIKVIVLKDE